MLFLLLGLLVPFILFSQDGEIRFARGEGLERRIGLGQEGRTNCIGYAVFHCGLSRWYTTTTDAPAGGGFFWIS